MNVALKERPDRLPLAAACRALGLNRSTLYARKKAPATGPRRSRKHVVQPRALSDAERQCVLAVLNSDAYCDQPPSEVYHDLLEQGHYLCSVSTMHRLLRAQRCQGERRKQRAPQSHAVPRLVATQPNEVWTWDISKLPTRQRGVYLSLYVVLDLFSRYIVAWMISRKENSALAQQLMSEAIDRYDIQEQQLTIHQDRGSPMIAQSYLDLMSEFGATCSHSRPRVSNDNAFSESQFKTLKYQPDYPGRFESLEHARQWHEEYVHWYNLSHHHSALAGFTPGQVYTQRYKHLGDVKQKALDVQYAKHPERFVLAAPTVALPPQEVAINPVQPSDDGEIASTAVNFPTLPYAKKLAGKSTLTLD